MQSITDISPADIKYILHEYTKSISFTLHILYDTYVICIF